MLDHKDLIFDPIEKKRFHKQQYIRDSESSKVAKSLCLAGSELNHLSENEFRRQLLKNDVLDECAVAILAFRSSR